MVRKLPDLAVLVASLAAACAGNKPFNIQNPPPIVELGDYSASQVHDLLKRRGSPLYFVADGELVRVEGLNPMGMNVYMLMDPSAGSEFRELSQEDPLRVKIEGNFHADLVIRSNGVQYGDDRGDEFSPLQQKPRVGREITDSDKKEFLKYLNYTGYFVRKQLGDIF